MSAKDGYTYVENYLKQDLLTKLTEIINNKDTYRFIEKSGYGRNRPYYIIDGEVIRKQYPDVLRLIEEFQPLADEMAGEKLKLMNCPKRDFRIHVYTQKSEGILWHIDAASYTALFTIKNDSETGVEVHKLGISRFLIIPTYALYFFQSFFALFRPDKFICKNGDLLFIKGGRAVHRTTPAFRTNNENTRAVLCISYDPVVRKTSWFRRNILNRINVTVPQVTNHTNE